MPDEQIVVEILEDHCKGCGLCVEFCPQGKLYLQERPNKRGVQAAAVRPEPDCTGCRQCATICPDAAVILYRRPASSRKETRRIEVRRVESQDTAE